jgi:Tat protein secretion system quality control protein TatD with DNase activity
MGVNEENDNEAIWGIGVCDAHCHPTDIMASVKDIANMRARVLTVMSTRAQDQEMVADTAERYPTGANVDFFSGSSRYVVPAFGWHPWFSHQIYDDRDQKEEVAGGHQSQEAAVEHYKSVLVPAPDELEFLRGLPTPIALTHFLRQTEARLKKFPHALVGEVGLDRSFRLPKGPSCDVTTDGGGCCGDTSRKTGGSDEVYTPGSREGRPLTQFRVNMEHQKTILRAQFELAAKQRRPVSVHSVQAHGVVFDLMQGMWKGHERPSKRERKRKSSAPDAHTSQEQSRADQETESALPYPLRICMHSYSGPPEALKQFLSPNVPADIYFSFSTAINFSSPDPTKVTRVIKQVPEDRILVESDLHCAGETMDDLLKEIVLKICEIKEWPVREGTQRLKQNWIKFVFG